MLVLLKNKFLRFFWIPYAVFFVLPTADGRHLLSVGQGTILPRRKTWIFRIMLMKS